MSLTASQPYKAEDIAAKASGSPTEIALLQDREVRRGWYYDYYYPVYPPSAEQQRRARYGEKDRYPSNDDISDRERYPTQNAESDRELYPDRDDESDQKRYPSKD